MNCRIAFLTLLLPVGTALADNYIEVSGGTMGTDYEVLQVPRTVQIMTPGTYVVRSSNGTGLGDIHQIWVETVEGGPVSGTVTVGVYDWDAGPSAAGADNVWEVNLAGATDGRLSTFRIAGNYGDSEHGGTMNARGAETIHIGADVVVPPAVEKAIEIPQPVSGPVTIGGKIFSPVSLGVVWGPLTVDGQIAADLSWTWNGADVDLKYLGTNPGEISIFSVAGDRTVRCRGYASKLTIETIEPNGLVQLDSGAGHITVVQDAEVGDLAGTLWVTGDVNQLDLPEVVASGVVDVSGNVFNADVQYSYGDITLGGVTGTLTSRSMLRGRLAIETLSGVLALAGNANGCEITISNLDGTVKIGTREGSVIRYAGTMSVTDMSGDILLDNGLALPAPPPPPMPRPPTIHIQTKTPAALVVVNNDGYNMSCDDWGGTVKVGSIEYAAENRNINLWLASCVVGDTNSDALLNSFDIDPFVLLITDPAAYCAAYPGLCGEGYDPILFAQRGSALYRGDLDCDGRLTSFDIDPFVQKLSNSNIWYKTYDCEVCPSGGMMMGGEFMEGLDEDLAMAEPSPEEIAALLAASVAPERLGVLAELAETLAAGLPEAERAEFWSAVADQLP